MVENDTMIYRNLGNSGLKVSALSFGTWIPSQTPEIEDSLFHFIKKSIDYGINFFDTAETYALGGSERVLGNILKKGDFNRENLIISTKFIRFGKNFGLSRKRLIQAMRNSLKRLQLDYVDIMYLHRFDQETPLLETVRAVNHLIEKGKADYWGTSEFSAYQIQEIHKICEKYGFIHPVVEQCEYNLFNRNNVEVEYVPLYEKYGMGTTVFSPLMGGVLSGKYNDMNIPEGSRLSMKNLPPQAKLRYEKPFLEENREKTGRMLNGIAEISRELGCLQSQLALAWCIKNNDVSSAIFGATKMHHVEENIGALDVIGRLSPEILERIEEIAETRPIPPINWRTWQPAALRR